jgi:photosystem II P680 reaction center D1 protein
LLVLQAELKFLLDAFHLDGVAGVFGGSFFSAIDGSLVGSYLFINLHL